MSNLATVLEWKYPGVEGIETREGILTAWPESIPQPTDEQISDFMAEYVEPLPTVSKRDFMKRFTDDERNTITAAALQSVPLARWKEGLLLADDIRLDHPDLLVGMNAIVTRGLLTEARKVEILTP
ncbi:hypothetical protein [Kiloniella majae]|uniref:hypothetical protein n=1 Tax=Kiloniella majae TaxID=1938558 RepID=UPI000A277282|nr:hypothetical protein [Kiloniella majae]